MKKMRHVIPVVLCIALVMVFMTMAAYAVGNESTPNVSIAVDKESVHVGDTITVTFSTKAVTLHTLTGGIKFDTTMLECVEAELANSDSALLKTNSDYTDPDYRIVELSSVERANKTGQVGFYSFGVNEASFAATDLFVATFKVLKAGEITITAYEDSFQGENNENVDSVTITATEKPVTNILYGDVNDDGEVDLLDEMLLSQYNAKWDVALNELNADVNGDGEIDMLDEMLLSQYNAKWDVTLGPVE